MANIEKTIQIVDAVFDCLPVVGIITNGAQILYKLAHKVDHTANPVNSTWKDNIKIHVLNKTYGECARGMIVFSGISNLIMFIIQGFKNELEIAVKNNNVEAVKLCLARDQWERENEEKAVRILSVAAVSSTPEVLELIMGSRHWTKDSFIATLRRCCVPNDSIEQNVNRILNRLIMVEAWQISQVMGVLAGFVEAGREDTADRILDKLPKADFSSYKDILVEYSYHPKGQLKVRQIEAIFNKSRFRNLEQIGEYCVDVHKIGKNYAKDPDFYAVHKKNVERMLTLVENPTGLIKVLSDLVNRGETQLLDAFLDKYNTLSVEDKLDIINKAVMNCDPSLKGLEHFFTRCQKDFSDEQCIHLLSGFSNLRDKTHVMEKIIEMRPNLEETHNEELSNIKKQIEKTKLSRERWQNLLPELKLNEQVV